MESYLTSPVLPDGVYRLDTSEPTTLGRTPENDISLSSGQVSRSHAEIVPATMGHRIVDRGSRNGTRVNGEDVSATGTPLLDGDEIAIGPFTLIYREYEGEPDVLGKQAQAREYDETTTVEAVETGEGFRASFQEDELLEMCELLAEGGKNGVLQVTGEGTEGRLFFWEGKLVDAEGPGYSRHQRARKLLSLQSGTFQFSERLLPEDKPRIHNPSLPLDELLDELR